MKNLAGENRVGIGEKNASAFNKEKIVLFANKLMQRLQRFPFCQ